LYNFIETDGGKFSRIVGEGSWGDFQKFDMSKKRRTMKKEAKRYDGIWGIMREMCKGIKAGDCIMEHEPVELPDSSWQGWEEWSKLLDPMFEANKKKSAVVWCVENGPFHKYIKKLGKQRRKK